MKYPICKIPTKVIERLIHYSNMGAKCNSEIEKREYIARIITCCSVLYDCGILTFNERVYVSRHFRTLVYFPCDGNCQECEYAIWITENLGESKIVGCRIGGNAR